MAGGDSINERDQRAYLARALADLPAQLEEDYGGRQEILRAARADAEKLFKEAAPEWRALRAAEERVRGASNSPITRWLLGIARLSNWRPMLWSPFLLGASLFVFAGFGSPPVAGLLAVGLGLLAATWLALPGAAEVLAETLSHRWSQHTVGRIGHRFRLQSWFVVPSVLLAVTFLLIWFFEPRPTSIRVTGLVLMFTGSILTVARQALGRPLLEDLNVAEESVAASRLAYERKLRVSALAQIRADLSTEDSYGTDLRYQDYSGLAEMEDSSREVPTSAK